MPLGGVDCRTRALSCLVVLFMEPGLEHPHQRGIKSIQPDHRRIGVVGVVVPAPVGRQDKIARKHRNALAIHNGIAAPALDDQAKRRRGMPVGPGNLARHHDLDVGDERVTGHPRQLGVGQAQNTALGLLSAHELGRSHRLRAQITPVPQERYGLASGLDADAAADPGRRYVLRAQLHIIVLQHFLRRLDIRKLEHWRSSLIRALASAEFAGNCLLLFSWPCRSCCPGVRPAPLAPLPAAPTSPISSADRRSNGARGCRCTPFPRKS